MMQVKWEEGELRLNYLYIHWQTFMFEAMHKLGTIQDTVDQGEVLVASLQVHEETQVHRMFSVSLFFFGKEREKCE